MVMGKQKGMLPLLLGKKKKVLCFLWVILSSSLLSQIKSHYKLSFRREGFRVTH